MRLSKFGRILSADGELQPLVAKARDIAALAGFVDGFLPPDLASQVRVANIREGELVLLAAARAEMRHRGADRRVLRTFRRRWSTALMAFLS